MKVSVIIPTRNRVHGIAACLDAVRRALDAARAADAEMILVNNGSTDNTLDVAGKWGGSCPYRFIVETEEKRGLSHARNRGMSVAAGDLLILLDDDCHMAEDHVAAALRHFANDTEPVLRCGRVDLGDPSDMPFTIATCTETLRWQRGMKEWLPLSGGVVPGCNVAMPRALQREVGFYDTRLGAGTDIPAGEDSDYVIRAWLAGFAIEYVPDMRVNHFHGRKTEAQIRKLIRNYAIGAGAVLAKYGWRHPNIRGRFMPRRPPVKSDYDERYPPLPPTLVRDYKRARVYYLWGALKYLVSLFGVAHAYCYRLFHHVYR